MAASHHSSTSQNRGNQVLKSQTPVWLSPGMGEAVGTPLPWPWDLQESQLHALKAAALLLQSLQLCKAITPPTCPAPAKAPTPEQPGSHPGPLLPPGTPGRWQDLAAHAATCSHLHGCRRVHKK